MSRKKAICWLSSIKLITEGVINEIEKSNEKKSAILTLNDKIYIIAMQK
tara:strand:- start:184 stop:330 length:147 start_codon:yes stop_codon:yes gene_type:complete